MKFLIPIVFLALAGCTNPPGMTFYSPQAVAGVDGAPVFKSVKVASFAVDFVGLKKFSINFVSGDVTIEFQDKLVLGQESYAVRNAKGEVIGTLTKSIVPGIYTARVIEAYGTALQKVIKESAAGVTGAILSAAGPVALGSGLSAIPVKY